MSEVSTLEALVDEHCTSKPQRDAAMKVAQLYAEQLLHAEHVPDLMIGDGLRPQAPVVLMLTSTDQISGAEKASVWPMLDNAKARFERFELVTFGHAGAEPTAQAWARRNGMPMREFGIAWHLPDGNGATVRNPKAVQTRNACIAAYVAAADVPLVVLYGRSQKDSNPRSLRRAMEIYALASKAGAFNSERPYRPEPVVADEPSEVLAGQPDVPIEA